MRTSSSVHIFCCGTVGACRHFLPHCGSGIAFCWQFFYPYSGVDVEGGRMAHIGIIIFDIKLYEIDPSGSAHVGVAGRRRKR